ncbi:hypothetical protein [uncultured Fibrobacter sp.]|uniref:hypothetical protein n=1 Tax=uncultured Fibrobacter sp. TaxID=261512 RepID=UPI0025D4F7B4|nr:hypothetical protein [uncultured Fibrobacter sp.]
MHEKIVTNNGVVIVPTVEIEDIGNQKFRVYGVLEQSKNYETDFTRLHIDSDSQMFSHVQFSKIVSHKNRIILEVIAW